jgi:hypothetical protein
MRATKRGTPPLYRWKGQSPFADQVGLGSCARCGYPFDKHLFAGRWEEICPTDEAIRACARSQKIPLEQLYAHPGG